MDGQTKRVYQFGPFFMNASERLLLREGQPVRLEAKAFDTLLVLVENSGRLVQKEELIKRVWPDSFVEEGNLVRNISLLRKVLAEGFADQPCIETVPKHGYRFTVSVSQVWQETALTIEQTTTSSLLIEEEETIIQDETDPSGSARAKGKRWRQLYGRPRPAFFALGGLLLLIPAGVILLARVHRPEPLAAVIPVKTIAVLPFKPISAEGSNPYLELGVADTLITKLSGLNQIIVRPTSAIRKYADVEQDPLAAGRDLRVEAVLEGSLQKLNDRVRVTVRLLRVADGQPLWAYKCDEYCADVFQIQDAVTERVAEALRLQLTGAEKRMLTKHATESPEAYQLYLKGRYFWNKRTVEGFKKAIEYFNRAIERDPAYALAYDGLADAYNFIGGYGGASQNETIPKARAAAKKAIELDGTLVEPHATLGLIAMNYDWDWQTCEQEYKRALKLNPNYATAHHWYSEYLTALGRFDEARAELMRAHELDPLSLIINSDIGKMLYFSRSYDAAIEQLRKTLELDPNFSEAIYYLTYSYAMKGRYDEAIAEYENAVRGLAPHEAELYRLGNVGYIYAVAGRQVEAQRALNKLKEFSQHEYINPWTIATICIGLGDKDQAFAWLEKACEEHNAAFTSLKVNPACDSLRSDPRFTDLRRRVRFPN